MPLNKELLPNLDMESVMLIDQQKFIFIRSFWTLDAVEKIYRLGRTTRKSQWNPCSQRTLIMMMRIISFTLVFRFFETSVFNKYLLVGVHVV